MVALWQILCQGLIVSEDKLLGVLWQLPYWNVGCKVQWTLQEQGWNRWNVSFRSLIQVIGQFWQVHLIEIILFVSWPIQNMVRRHTRKHYYLLILSNTLYINSFPLLSKQWCKFRDIQFQTSTSVKHHENHVNVMKFHYEHW